MYVLKKLPEDFVVVEQLELPVHGEGAFLIVRVTKRQQTTEEVAQALAAALGIDRKAVGYCGMKDKHAVTTQHYSLQGVTAERVERLAMGFGVQALGYREEALALGTHAGNAFTIVVRNLTSQEDLELPASVPNYIDEQRFGTHNAELGRLLLKNEWQAACDLVIADHGASARLVSRHLELRPKDYVGALRNIDRAILRIYLHAYQGAIWNRALADYIGEHASRTARLPYSQGVFLFPGHADAIPPADIPLPGFSTCDDELLEGALEDEGLQPTSFVLKQFTNLSLEGSPRAALMSVADYAKTPFAPDELHEGMKKATLSFKLHNGSYATMLARALLTPLQWQL